MAGEVITSVRRRTLEIKRTEPSDGVADVSYGVALYPPGPRLAGRWEINPKPKNRAFGLKRIDVVSAFLRPSSVVRCSALDHEWTVRKQPGGH